MATMLEIRDEPGLEDLCSMLAMSGEKFMLKSDLEEMVKSTKWTIVCTDKALYKFEPGTSLRQYRSRKALMDIHSVAVDPSDNRVFHTYIYKSKAKLRLNKMKGAMGLGMDFASFLQKRLYICSTAIETFQWVFVLNRIVRNLWQSEFERVIVPAPEIYQRHDFVIKMNRKGASQDRMLILSTQWLYNVEVTHNPTTVTKKGQKWALPLSALSELQLVDDNRLIMKFDNYGVVQALDAQHMGAKGGHVNEAHEFMFRTAEERYVAVADIWRLYADLRLGRELVVKNAGAAAGDNSAMPDFKRLPTLNIEDFEQQEDDGKTEEIHAGAADDSDSD